MFKKKLAAVCVFMIPSLVARLALADAAEDAVPEALKVPSGQVRTLSAKGDGVQIYECAPAKDDPTHFAWTLKSPEATLRDESGKSIGKHYAGPTWEALDGSKVVGELVTKVDAPDGLSIPWLLLRAKAGTGSGIFSDIVSIQRIRTSGGKAPAAGCDAVQAGKEARVPYSAVYRYYRVSR